MDKIGPILAVLVVLELFTGLGRAFLEARFDL